MLLNFILILSSYSFVLKRIINSDKTGKKKNCLIRTISGGQNVS